MSAITAVEGARGAASPGAARRVVPRRYLMCPPRYFDVTYAINPWMDPGQGVDRGRALQQWEALRDTYLELGHRVDLIDPVAGLPDMVFAANAAVVGGDRALVARFRHPERHPESEAYLAWFHANGFRAAHQARAVNEGEGDFLRMGNGYVCGSGFRSAPDAATEVQQEFPGPVLCLELVDPRYYHLDTALAVLDDEQIMYFPGAFSAASQEELRRRFPDAITACAHDAALFGLNAVSDGEHVVLPAGTALTWPLADHGYTPIEVDVAEFRRGGGAVKCCTLELRDLEVRT